MCVLLVLVLLYFLFCWVAGHLGERPGRDREAAGVEGVDVLHGGLDQPQDLIVAFMRISAR